MDEDKFNDVREVLESNSPATEIVDESLTNQYFDIITVGSVFARTRVQELLEMGVVIVKVALSTNHSWDVRVWVKEIETDVSERTVERNESLDTDEVAECIPRDDANVLEADVTYETTEYDVDMTLAE